MPAESLFQALQKIATFIHRLDELTADHKALAASVDARLDRLAGRMEDTNARITDL